MHAMHSLKAWSTAEEMEAAIKFYQFEAEQIEVGPPEERWLVVLNVGQMTGWRYQPTAVRARTPWE